MEQQSFPKATTKEAVDQISQSTQSILPIEDNLVNYRNFLRKIFAPENNNPNDKVGTLWSGVIFPTIGDHGREYGGDTPEKYVPKIKINFEKMQDGSESEKQIAAKIFNAIKVLPDVVKQSNQLLPKIKQAKSEAESHRDKAWLGAAKQRRDTRFTELSTLEGALEDIIYRSENDKNKMIIEAIMSRDIKRDQMAAFSAIEKGTKNPKTGEINTNPLNRDAIKSIQQFIGGKRYSKCKKMKGKKYNTRKSPAYSASKCAKGTKKKGNDGKMYVVKSAKNGVKRWVKYTRKKKSKSKK